MPYPIITINTFTYKDFLLNIFHGLTLSKNHQKIYSHQKQNDLLNSGFFKHQ